MFRVRSIQSLPANFPEFLEEIAEGLSALYGHRAGAHYRQNAEMSIQTAMRHPSVQCAAVFAGDRECPRPDAAAILLAVTRHSVAQFSLVHVLGRFTGLALENQLITHMVSTLREGGVSGIVCESLPMTDVDLDGPFRALGFGQVERLLMECPLRPDGLARPTLKESVPLTPDDLPGLADTIVDAYRDHPGRWLHSEVRHVPNALAFLQSALHGGYGATRASFCRVVRRDGRVVAGLAGTEIVPGTGFVLQVAVRRANQGRGLGTLLMKEVAQCFCESGLERIALGVTAGNPARRLYERLGFRRLRTVNAYAWWDAAGDIVSSQARLV
ncbi:MAG: GNAT family N-acetyltransferase [Candidatus Hydrogenedentes bacterium]|nr:GNAT family N-acetyltransferase [Candidatus Hydrogenedentota bacterium]